MLWQEVNGRFYGLYFAFAVFTALLFLVIAEHPRPSRLLLFLLFVSHVGLVSSHTLGLIFSFSLVLGSVVLDRVRHRVRWSVYLVPAAAWLVVALSLPSIRASAAVARNGFWTHKPDLGEFAYSFAGYGRVTALLLGLLVAASGIRALALWSRGVQATGRAHPRQRPTLPLAPAALVGSLGLAALIFFAKSQTGVSIYADRYLLPLLIATAFGIVGALSWLRPQLRTSSHTPMSALGWSLVTLVPCCLFALTRQTNHLLYPHGSYIQQLTRQLDRNLPVITVLPPFTLLHTYDPNHRYLYMTNWAYDEDPRHPADYAGGRLMENWKRAGYFSEDILSCPEVFHRYSRLTVLVDPYLAPWFNDRLLHDASFRLTRVGSVTEWDPTEIWLVERIHPGPAPC